MSSPKLTVLFDGGCPLCSREISHYRKVKSRLPIEWVDVTREDEVLQRLGVKREDAMAEFHVFDGNGALHKGADGFVALWSVLPYYRWLSLVCRPLLPFLRKAYAGFARWHYRGRCSAGVCR